MEAIDVSSLSKKELNKLKKKEAKKCKQDEAKLSQQVEEVVVDDYSSELYGDVLMGSTVNYVDTYKINGNMGGQFLWIKGYLHASRKTGKQIFVVVRDDMSLIQCVTWVDERVSRQMVNFINNVPKESVIELYGEVKVVEKPVESCTQSDVEIKFEKLFVISRAKQRLNLQIEDAMRPENDESNLAKVNLDTKLDNRTLDLRTPANHGIMRVRSKVELMFNQFLDEDGFYKIGSPSLIGAASEGGSNVFEVKYFDTKAYLAQSPQLYKQMCIVGGLKKVYVTGPVFRAENSNTHRHLTEFTGLDLEMEIKVDYHEVLDTICNLLIRIFRGLESSCAKELEVIKKQYPFEPFTFVEPALILTFREGVQMLREAGVQMDDFEDLSTPNEKLLGKLVKQKYGTDFFVLDKFPLAVRPFYTMPDPNDKNYSNSYDIFMRGEEIMSGAQRIHNAEFLKERALAHGIDLNTIKDYINSFECGCSPHAGGGIGLERVVMLYLGMNNIRLVTPFPRDPKRLAP